MLTVTFDPFRLTLLESLGLAHEEQIVEIPVPDGASGLLTLRDEASDRLYPVQVSRQKPGRGFLRLAVEPHQTLSLVPADRREQASASLTITERDGAWLLQNKYLSIKLVAGAKDFEARFSPEPLAGPVIQVKQHAGPWRGKTFFDTASPPIRQRAEWLERGPLRAVYHYRIEFAREHFYDLVLTADATVDFVRLEESFSGAAADQIVWDFSGDDLPESLSLLDSTAGHASKQIHYQFDQRHARLWGWTQFSQLHDLSDGFALQFSGAEDVVGVVALAGGNWQGNALNHLEGWSRRWESGDPSTRRLPADTKADGFPGPERIAARGESICTPHFSLEGWLRRGTRTFALVLSTRKGIAPVEEKSATPLGHFEDAPDRDRYRAQQGRLRKIQIQYGLMPLQDQLAMTLAWPMEKAFEAGEPGSSERQRALKMAQLHWAAPPSSDDPDRIQQINDYLQARVFGFWEGSGAAYSNCVVGRKIGPAMLGMESLVRQGKLDSAMLSQWRAWFAFLAYLNASKNFYPGPATMEPMGSLNTTEPTLAGMANQNFYTDALAVFGLGGEVFRGHPQASSWRDRFIAQWRRQLAYHVYPESGLWEESHTYYQHVLATVLPLLLRRKEAGTDDPFADPALQKLIAGSLPQLTPRDAVMGGVRHFVAFGDHGADVVTYRYLYPEYAQALASHAPELARHLVWMGREMGGEAETEITPLQPAWKHGRIQGLGFFFRGIDAGGNENLLALRSGTAWGHHHEDEGSIQFFAQGRALVVDSAFSRPQENGAKKLRAFGHSKPAPEGVEPLHHLWRFNRGWILDSRAEGDLAYAVAGVPIYATWPKDLEAQMLPRACWELRAVMELAPAVYLVADYLDPARRHQIRFHVAHPEVKREGSAISCSFDGTCQLQLVPLTAMEPPLLSTDRPLQNASRETTTAVEYAGVTGPWSLFVVAAFSGQGNQLTISDEGRKIELEETGVAFSIRHGENEILEVSREGSKSMVRLEPATLLAALRAGRAL